MSKITSYSSLRSNKERIPLGESVPLMGPLSVYLETTNICNFKCVFCPESFTNYSEISGGLFRLSSDDFSRVADQLAEVRTVKTLNFYMMGEPFANKELLSFVSEAKRKKSLSESS
jgi:MoaA/NifB/PqqE/SkfB family radical SAM enzyme